VANQFLARRSNEKSTTGIKNAFFTLRTLPRANQGGFATTDLAFQED
jgi:hypothetical protein